MRLKVVRKAMFAMVLTLVVLLDGALLGNVRYVEGDAPPTPSERAALEWLADGVRAPADVFPDQGMPERARPTYALFRRDDPEADTFYVVFEESGWLFTGRYRMNDDAGDPAEPTLEDLLSGYGWFDLSRSNVHLDIWAIDRSGGYRRHDLAAGLAAAVGAAFEIDRYDTGPAGDQAVEAGDRGVSMYLNGAGFNIGDAAGKPRCFLSWGSQSALVEGPYLDEAVSPGRAFFPAGSAHFAKPLDDLESGGVDCRAAS